MKQVYSARDPLSANMLKALLNDRGIRAEVQGEQLFPLQGEIPLVSPTVWVADEDVESARTVAAEFGRQSPVTAALGAATEEDARACPACHEEAAEPLGQRSCYTPMEQEERHPPPPALAQPLTLAQKAKRALVVSVVLVAVLGGYSAYRDHARREARRHVAFGVSHYNQGAWDAAIAAFTKAIETDAGNAEAYAWRGCAFHGKGDYPAALSDYDHAVQLDPKDVSYYVSRANLHLLQEDRDAATRDADLALRLDPSCSSAHLTRAAICEQAGDFGAAIEGYTHALAIDDQSPEAYDAYVRRGYAHLSQAHFDSALSDAEAALGISPTGTEACLLRACVRTDLGELALALADCTRAIRADRRMAEAYIRRAWLFGEQREFTKALADCDAALRITPDAVEARLCRARCLAQTGELEEARAEFKRVTEIRDDADYWLRAYAWARLGDFERALREGQAGQKRWPGNPWVCYSFTLIYSLRSQSHGDEPEPAKARQADLDLAFKHLEEAVRKGLRPYAPLRTSPDLEPLRADPRFERLLAKP